ncbi:MAG: alpha/beta hydrolase [Verrucomicrobiae bacterium]|nr:alpha/beta hydrolase [Verrucomicrobiae bacterium]MCP5541030.1 alpha/beta hydrolase [Akkermansiaceae bacterium]MCP5551549.1 alpha/beta hydrolase [Akkermansiaceae bacterium]
MKTFAIILMMPSLLDAAQPTILNIWPGTPPGPVAKVEGAERDLTKPEDKLIAGRPIIKLGNVSTPEMHVYLPPKDKANGGAVLVCPGGGFSILAWDLEGTEVAEWLNTLGFAAIVVKYRVPTREHGNDLNEAGNAPLKAVGPVMDAQRAMSLTRAHAAEWGLDPERIGIMGFSAGGETAGLASMLGNERLYPKVDAGDEPSCAPDFTLLIYPGGFYDKESGGLKPYLKVTKDTPPMFFVMAQDDHVNPLNCTVLYSELTKNKLPAELHLFTRGGHGYGLRPTLTPVTHWPNRAAKWLKDMGFASSPASLAEPGTVSSGNPADHLPPNVMQITKFGERAEFSHDSQRVLFLSKQFGDVMEYTIRTGKIRCLTQHFKHHGFNRVMVLSNGDYLLTGPDETFDATDREARLKARHFAKLFVLDRGLTKPPTPLGFVAAEGPAVSRTQLKIAWTHHREGELRQTAISTGDIVYESGIPKLANTRLVLTTKDFPEGRRPKMIETQNFVGPDDKTITLSAYLIENGHNTEGYTFDLEAKQLTNFSNTPDDYEEVEGIFPDGLSTLVERNRSVGKPWPVVDAWRVWFDGSKEPQRLTRFLDFPGYKASNYVVSDDGRLMAFQLGISGDEAGVGYGLFLMELDP